MRSRRSPKNAWSRSGDIHNGEMVILLKSKRLSLGILTPASPGPRLILTKHIRKHRKSLQETKLYIVLPPDWTPGYYTSNSINLNNAARSPSSARGTQSVPIGAGLSRSSSVGSGSPAWKGRHEEIQRMSLPLEKQREQEKERPPLTLAEK